MRVFVLILALLYPGSIWAAMTTFQNGIRVSNTVDVAYGASLSGDVSGATNAAEGLFPPKTANFFYGGPTSAGPTSPTFRALVASDVPSLSYVTSVAASVPSFLSLAGSPITSSGTLAITLQTETANTVFAGATSGGVATPTFRTLVAADIPSLSYVSSVALALPNIFTISGSPVTTSGTLTGTLATETANTVFAGATSGGAATPTFRSLVVADIPTGTYATLTATAFYVPTNTFTGPTNNLDVSVGRQFYSSFTSCSFTGLTGKAAGTASQSVLLKIYNASATNITLTIPSSVMTTDGLRQYTITNLTRGLISVDWDGESTNAVFRMTY